MVCAVELLFKLILGDIHSILQFRGTAGCVCDVIFAIFATVLDVHFLDSVVYTQCSSVKYTVIPMYSYNDSSTVCSQLIGKELIQGYGGILWKFHLLCLFQ